MKKSEHRGQEELEESSRVFDWNRLLMSTLGLWPSAPDNFIFFVTFGYFCYEMALEYLDLFFNIYDFELVLMNLTENSTFTLIGVRILVMRQYNRAFGRLFDEAKRDFDAAKYTDDERRLFISYHDKSRMFIKLLVGNTTLTATSYYAKPILVQIIDIIEYVGSNGSNATIVYLLPYRFYTFYEINDAFTYFWTYLSQLPFVYVSLFGQTASDCLMVTLVYHVSGQMAVLAERIENIPTDPLKGTHELHNVVRAHTRLLRTGKTLEKAFSTMLLGNLMCATLGMCVIGYQILVTLAVEEKVVLVTYMIVVVLVLFVQCTIGESLLTESARITEAYYRCNWYNMPQKNAEIIILCMARSQRPLQLKAGKFSTFCLATLTNSLKTSMGYLSVLRTVM